MSGQEVFLALRSQVLAAMENPASRPPRIEWPAKLDFNWARDHFDRLAAENVYPALRLVNDDGHDHSISFADLAHRSKQVANFLAARGVRKGERILLMLSNVTALWETMLASIRLGAVVIPATTLLERGDLKDRFERGQVRAVVTDSGLAGRFDGLSGAPVRIAVGDALAGWHAYEDSLAESDDDRHEPTTPEDLLLLYFTSGTTARPKLVAHTHISYPVGHLSTMYWIGLRPGDTHLNLSSPGWAKHAWSCFFAPWNAGATVVAYQYDRFSARALLDQLVRCNVTTFCAPPTVWRMLIQEDLAQWPVRLREIVGAGEPLNPEVIEQVRLAWGLTIRDGFGQTETTAQVGNPPGHVVKPGSMGRPLPGYEVVLVGVDGNIGHEGEICLDLSARPIGLMQGYLDDPQKTADVTRGGYYHTGDVASCDAEGYLTYIGRTDDVFKSSDYRISPFELESVLIEHDAVAEAAVVPSPDPMRLAVPKAFIVLRAGVEPNAATARAIFAHVQARVSPFKRVRRLEFAELPKTLSGKIRRVELRQVEANRVAAGERGANEFWERDFPDLRQNSSSSES
jgi:acetyl-CoA synthetase